MNPEEVINKLNKKKIKSEVFQSSNETTSIIFENSNFKKIESKSVKGTGLRVIKNGKIGFSYAGGDETGNIIDFACENSIYGNKAEFEFPNKEYEPVKNLFNKDVEDIPVSDLKATGQEIIETLNNELKEYKINAEVEKESSRVHLSNSNGFNGSFRKTYYSVYFSVMRAKDDEIFSTYDGDTTLNLENDYKERMKRLIEMCKKLETKSKISTGKYPVIFSPKASYLLYSILTFALNGKNIQKGASPLSTSKREKIFANNFSIRDNPKLEGGISSVPFDGEGMPSKDKYLVNKGRVENFVYDLFTAQLMNEASTSNGRRGYSTVPSPGFYNLVVEPGTTPYQDLIAGVKNGLYVEDFIGGGQSNVMAGEFSVNLTMAFKIENGELKGSVKDTMLSGNVYNVFKNDPVFGDTLYKKNKYLIPYILANGLSVSS